MPLYYKEDLPDGGRTAIWHVTEDPEEIKAKIREQTPGFNLSPPGSRYRRISEWFATRLLVSLCGYNPDLNYDEKGKPFLHNSTSHISISHSGPYVAIIVHPDKKTGIDIEVTGERIQRIKQKFVGSSESTYLKPNIESEMLYIIWGAKECAFKIYGKGNIDFKKNLKVKSFEFATTGTTEVELEKTEESEKYSVNWEYFGNLMVVYALDHQK